jgi:hypothetical protein
MSATEKSAFQPEEASIANSVADFGQPLMDNFKSTDAAKMEQARGYMDGELSYLTDKFASVMNRPEGAKLVEWMQEQAKDPENVLFRVLLGQQKLENS